MKTICTTISIQRWSKYSESSANVELERVLTLSLLIEFMLVPLASSADLSDVLEDYIVLLLSKFEDSFRPIPRIVDQ